MRRIRILLLAVLAVPLLLLGGLWVALPRVELAGFAAARATAALGRGLAIGSLRIRPGRVVTLALRGLRLDNIEGGTRPAMMELASLDAELELMPLLRGRVVLRRGTGEGFVLHLERAAGRRANWHFGPHPAAVPAEPAPPDLTGFPLLREVRLTGSEIVFRTTGGQLLRTRIEEAQIATEGADAPVRLAARGSYNGVPVTLEGDLGSTAALREAPKPFPMQLRAASGRTTLHFEGTATDPLNFDGLDGRLAGDAPDLDTILRIAGAEPGPQAAVALAGAFTRQGDLWRLHMAGGTLDGAEFTAPLLEIREGAAGRPDHISAEAGFTRLDLNRILEGGESRGDGTDMPLLVPAEPDPVLRLDLAAQELAFWRMQARDVQVLFTQTPGRIAAEIGRVTVFGARSAGSVELAAREDGAVDAAATLNMIEGDLDQLRRAFGLRPLPALGTLEARLRVTSRARRVQEAVNRADIAAVVAMRRGSIAREVIEMASTDIRSLFRTPRGMTPVSCLLAVVNIRAGRGEAAPLRIRAGTGTVSGLASFDLKRETLDLVIGSQRDTTSFWALDIPVRVSGSFADPGIAPAEWSRAGRERLARSDEVVPLPPTLRDFARRNPCYARR